MMEIIIKVIAVCVIALMLILSIPMLIFSGVLALIQYIHDNIKEDDGTNGLV
jgi:uncharacterized membrane protein